MSSASRLDVGGRAFEEQRVAHAHHQVVELAADILVPAMHRQRVDAVAAAQAQIAKAAARPCARPA
jgi:hypothetical protein